MWKAPQSLAIAMYYIQRIKGNSEKFPSLPFYVGSWKNGEHSLQYNSTETFDILQVFIAHLPPFSSSSATDWIQGDER